MNNNLKNTILTMKKYVLPVTDVLPMQFVLPMCTGSVVTESDLAPIPNPDSDPTGPTI